MALAELLPQWTTELKEQTSGLDHLGLGSVSQGILGNLVPDLFVMTIHPGYHSFYSFVLDEFWRRDDLPRTRAFWRRFFRSKELIYSIACNMCEHPDYEGLFANIVGSGKTAGPQRIRLAAGTTSTTTTSEARSVATACTTAR